MIGTSFLRESRIGSVLLGSGVCSEKIPVISQIANEWAKKYDYPMEDFLGYRINDWDFGVLCWILDEYLEISGRKHFYVQLVPGDDVSRVKKEKVQKSLDCYFNELNNQVYWHGCHKLSAELRTQWEAFNGGT